MTTVFAQGAAEYVGGASGSIIAVLGERFNTLFNTVSYSVSDHPVLWGAGVCLAAWLLFRRR
jgi:uncharacterized protein (TIGR03382 family)